MRYALALLALLALAGCSALEPADCKKADLAAYADQIQNQIDVFRQQSDLVGAAPRMSIGDPLQRLLDIQTETRAIAAPGCLADYHARVLEAMNAHQVAYQQFAAQSEEGAVVAIALEEAGAQLDEVEAGLGSIKGGTVPPTPTPVPTPEPVSPPEAGTVERTALLVSAPNPQAKGAFQVCPDDRFEVNARDGDYVRVRITADMRP